MTRGVHVNKSKSLKQIGRFEVDAQVLPNPMPTRPDCLRLDLASRTPSNPKALVSSSWVVELLGSPGSGLCRMSTHWLLLYRLSWGSDLINRTRNGRMRVQWPYCCFRAVNNWNRFCHSHCKWSLIWVPFFFLIWLLHIQVINSI